MKLTCEYGIEIQFGLFDFTFSFMPIEETVINYFHFCVEPYGICRIVLHLVGLHPCLLVKEKDVWKNTKFLIHTQYTMCHPIWMFLCRVVFWLRVQFLAMCQHSCVVIIITEICVLLIVMLKMLNVMLQMLICMLQLLFALKVWGRWLHHGLRWIVITVISNIPLCLMRRCWC